MHGDYYAIQITVFQYFSYGLHRLTYSSSHELFPAQHILLILWGVLPWQKQNRDYVLYRSCGPQISKKFTISDISERLSFGRSYGNLVLVYNSELLIRYRWLNGTKG